jgi:hypothetical protein
MLSMTGLCSHYCGAISHGPSAYCHVSGVTRYRNHFKAAGVSVAGSESKSTGQPACPHARCSCPHRRASGQATAAPSPVSPRHTAAVKNTHTLHVLDGPRMLHVLDGPLSRALLALHNSHCIRFKGIHTQVTTTRSLFTILHRIGIAVENELKAAAQGIPS